MLYAVVDIGTRAGRVLIINKVSNNKYEILHKMSEVLSVGLSISNDIINLDNKHIVKLKTLLIKALEKCIEYNIPQDHILMIGTEAFRKAKNLKIVLHHLYINTGAQIKILSPAEEADYALMSAMDSLIISNEANNLIMDIGGGSAELIIVNIHNEQILYKDWISIPVGIMLPKIRGSAKYVSHHISNIVRYYISNFYLRNGKYYPVNIIGIKSSFFQIASKILRKKSIPHGQSFTYEEVIESIHEIYNHMSRIHLESINDVINVRSIAILKTILEIFPFKNVYISNHGLLHGVINKLLNEK